MSRERMLRIKHSILKRGLMMHTCGHFGNVFRYMGALNIPREYVETGAEIFEESLKTSA
jgi:4-aminobutyrate aminotransferase-like enzyme